MWIVDDDGDIYNTDKFMTISFTKNVMNEDIIYMETDIGNGLVFKLSKDLTAEERLARYCDLVEMITGEELLVRKDGIFPHLR